MHLPLRFRFFCAASVLLFAPCRGTTVVAPTFAELVDEAQTIVRARVIELHSAWADSPQGRVIKTHVTFRIEKQLKGGATPELTLSFLGGELDGQGMRVAGMPQFTVGQTEILFIAGNGVRFCPLVAMMHGRYHVQTDAATGREYMARNDGIPLLSEHDVQLPQDGNPLERPLKPVSAALSPAAFEQRIVSQISPRVSQP
jgi:hypothetical protein